MNTQQIEDLKLLYEAVYDEDLRIQSEDYNNIVFDEDIVEIATEYFYNYGLNENGVGILIEKVGLDNFVEFVYSLSDDLMILSEARKAKRRSGGKSYDEVKAEIEERESKKRAKKEAKDKASKAAEERKESERKDPESKGPDTEAKKEQSKSRPIRDAIARRILAGMERHRKATQTADKMAKETGETLSKLASVTREAGRRAGEHVKTYGLKSLANEEFEYWVNSLVEEGYDLSDYTWDDMVEIYLNEGNGLLGTVDSLARNTAGTVGGAIGRGQASKKPGANLPIIGDIIKNEGERRGRKTGQQMYDRAKQTVGGLLRQDYEHDVFDMIFEYLVSEGYADTNENALVIMANMSEEWKQSIVESIARGSAPNSPSGTIGGAAGRVAGTLLQRGAELIKKNMPQSGGGKPYRDGPLWDGPKTPVKNPVPQRKPQGAPMRDEPLW